MDKRRALGAVALVAGAVAGEEIIRRNIEGTNPPILVDSDKDNSFKHDAGQRLQQAIKVARTLPKEIGAQDFIVAETEIRKTQVENLRAVRSYLENKITPDKLKEHRRQRVSFTENIKNSGVTLEIRFPDDNDEVEVMEAVVVSFDENGAQAHVGNLINTGETHSLDLDSLDGLEEVILDRADYIAAHPEERQIKLSPITE